MDNLPIYQHRDETYYKVPPIRQSSCVGCAREKGVACAGIKCGASTTDEFILIHTHASAVEEYYVKLVEHKLT